MASYHSSKSYETQPAVCRVRFGWPVEGCREIPKCQECQETECQEPECQETECQETEESTEGLTDF
jgi:hypothetical protein